MNRRDRRSGEVSQNSSRLWRPAAIAGLLSAIALLGWINIAPWARRSAARHLEAGAIGAAERSLDWAAWLSGHDAHADVLRAACFRRLGDIDAWHTTLEAAERNGAQATAVELERRLGTLRWGQVENVTWDDYNTLVESGAAPRDAIHAVVHGMLAKRNGEKAQKLIDAWESNAADPSEAAFLRGVCFWSAGDLNAAQAEFERTLASEPGYEMAHAGLARIFEDQHRYTAALEHDFWLVAAAPQRESARVNLARMLRKVGRLQDAQAVIAQLAKRSEESEIVALELVDQEFESGDYEAAQDRLDRLDLEGGATPETIRTAATTAALRGDFAQAERLFARIDDPQGISRRKDELLRRIALDPADAVAATELAQLAVQPAILSPPPGDETSATMPAALFSKHCAACHGNEGDGAGRAARHVFPRPRNLRTDQYRLISRLDHIPSLDDIERVIRDGIPGTSMPSFARLSADQQRKLAEEVFRLYEKRFGATSEGRTAADDQTAAGTVPVILSVPAIGTSDGHSITRGKDIYVRSGCHHCHGEDGTAATAVTMYDDAGQPTVPRNLVHDPLKGGLQAESIYRRIRLGMPGTPHPASPGLEEAEIVALVHYCQSLGQEPKLQLTNAERAARAARRAPRGVDASGP